MGSSAFSESSAVIVTYQATDVVDTTSTSIEISWKNLGYCSAPDVDRFEMQIMDCLHKKWITTSDELTGRDILQFSHTHTHTLSLSFLSCLADKYSLTHTHVQKYLRYHRTRFRTKTKPTVFTSSTTSLQAKWMEGLVRLCCNGTRADTVLISISSRCTYV